MEANTIKIKKMFASYMKEKIWLEEQALKGYKLCNITMGYIYEFEKIEPTRLVYEVERFDVPAQPTPGDIRRKERFMEMAEETGWEIVTWDESLTYYLCKAYDEHDVNELYNDEESRLARAARFRSSVVDLGRSIMGFALAINIIMFILFAIDGFKIDHLFTKVYLVITLVYSILTLIVQYVYKKLGDMIYTDLSMSAEEWKKKFDYSKENVKKCTKMIVRSKALVKYLNKQAADGWYLSSASMFSYTFTKEKPVSEAQVYYVIDNKSAVRRRLKAAGSSLERNKKDINNLSGEWMEQSIKTALKENLQYVCAFQRQYTVYLTTDAATAESFQKKSVPVGWMAFTTVWFVIICGLIGGIVGFIAGIMS